ncbi:Down syndrome cell adhesion molecule homolog isoform X2 [Actinia tenebrosa]|uniref:Down syndrome cell adhesion molecule homolog isoform X2 n=1 Tax=Actinia tenebrosa TaxID=6105 RepID=A0A6P8HB68_ACTTE|nr:Down syndrome cell adhesion molecule homolog isoform X2 [Actinia tenebrosa]
MVYILRGFIFILLFVMFIIAVKPTVNESYSTSKSKSWNGNSIHLRCFATGLPSPRISWYKPTNQQITTGVIIVPGGSEVTVLTATDQADYGQYKCRATNILGSDEHVINVTKLSPVSLTITDVEASSINVTWYKPADDGGLDVTGYLVEVSTKPPVITVNTNAVVTGLKANTLYAVKVYAKNIVGYGVGSSKIIRTQKIGKYNMKGKGKPSAPELVIALLERSPEFKLSVLLRWEEPDDNGGNISRYTIYVKEVEKKAEWTKYDNVIDSKQFEYKITKDIVYGKTYMFMVTAWNKYGESVKDEGGAKTVNTTADKATATNGRYQK